MENLQNDVYETIASNWAAVVVIIHRVVAESEALAILIG